MEGISLVGVASSLLVVEVILLVVVARSLVLVVEEISPVVVANLPVLVVVGTSSAVVVSSLVLVEEEISTVAAAESLLEQLAVGISLEVEVSSLGQVGVVSSPAPAEEMSLLVAVPTVFSQVPDAVSAVKAVAVTGNPEGCPPVGPPEVAPVVTAAERVQAAD